MVARSPEGRGQFQPLFDEFDRLRLELTAATKKLAASGFDDLALALEVETTVNMLRDAARRHG